MAGSLLLYTVVLPLLMGVIVAGLAFFSPANRTVMTLATVIAVLFVYYFLEGLPPLPPVSSKHKIFYIFSVLGVAAMVSPKLRERALPVLAGGLMLGAMLWIAQRKIESDPFQPEIFLALIPVVGFGIASAAPKTQREDVFLWPSALIAMAISGSLVSILGSYIGLARMLGATAALIGGFLAIGFVAVHLLGRPLRTPRLAQANWFLMAAVSTILVSIAVFARTLSPVAFSLVCLMYLTPFVASRFVGRQVWWAPFAMGGVSLVPALLAIAFAWIQSA